MEYIAGGTLIIGLIFAVIYFGNYIPEKAVTYTFPGPDSIQEAARKAMDETAENKRKAGTYRIVPYGESMFLVEEFKYHVVLGYPHDRYEYGWTRVTENRYDSRSVAYRDYLRPFKTMSEALAWIEGKYEERRQEAAALRRQRDHAAANPPMEIEYVESSSSRGC